MDFSKAFRYFIIFSIGLVFSLSSYAEDKAILMDSWIIDLQPDQHAAFSTALKSHLEDRAKQNEPRDWWVYTPVTGENMNRYIVRSCCHTWSSFDQHKQWRAQHSLDPSWQTLLAQHTSNYSHRISKADFPNSRWPEGLLVPPLMGITEYHIKSGHDSAFQEAKSKMSELAISGEWQRDWLWVETVTGENIETLMVLHQDFSDIAPLEIDIFDVLSKQLKSDEKAGQLFTDFFSHVESESYQIFEARPELFVVPE